MEPTIDWNDRESLIAWLTWNDRNGCYTDEDCDCEGLPRLSLESAAALVKDQSERDEEPTSGCAECARSRGNNYNGLCEH